MHLVMGFSFPLEQILTEATSEPLSGGTSQSQLRPSEQHTKQLLWATKCILECQRCDAHSPGGNSSPPYWGKLSSVTACWTWRTARWSLHKVGVLAFLEHTAPYGSADVQSSWEVAEDNTVVLCAWQRQEFCIHLCLHSGSPLPSGAKLNKQLRCITGPPNPFKKCKAEHPPHTHTHSVTSYELSLPHSLLRKLSPQSPPHSSARERRQLWNHSQKPKISADVQISFCTPETGRLLPTANSSGLLLL